MFSFRCLGCDDDLRMDELVRMNGHIQIYDGYGGSVRDYDRPGPCWHEWCYQQMPFSEKNTQDSPYARNQGFGYPRLRYLDEYDEDKPVTYYPVYTASLSSTNKEGEKAFKDAEIYLVGTTPHMARLRCDRAWNKREKKVMERIYEDLRIDDVDFRSRLYERLVSYAYTIKDHEMGMNPCKGTIYFNDPLKAFRDMMLRTATMWKTRDAAEKDRGYRQISIFGIQPRDDKRDLHGLVYESDILDGKDFSDFLVVARSKLNAVQHTMRDVALNPKVFYE